MSLKRERELREDARRLAASMIDPSIERQTSKAAREITFEGVAREWLGMQEKKLAGVTLAKACWMLETFIFPDLGCRPIGEITAPDLLDVLRKIEERGTR